MKFLFNFMDKNIAPLFEKEGKLNFFYPLFEAGDTFIRTPAETTKTAPFARDSIDQKRLMIFVIYALIPAILFGIWNAGHLFNVENHVGNASFFTDIIRGSTMVIPIILVSYIVGGIWEVLFALIRKHEINEGFLVTGMLFPLILPPTLPLWQVALGVSFGVIIGKEIFGGVGFNILNPALTGRAFLFFAYPAQISGDRVWVGSAKTTVDNLFLGDVTANIDGVTQATPLAVASAADGGAQVIDSLNAAGFTLWDMTLGTIPGCIGSTSAIAMILGMIFLLITGIISWRVILSGFLGVIATAVLFNILPLENAFATLPFYYHLVMGGFLFGLIFMATDPVSCAGTNVGKWIYGFMIGALTILIRVANPAYPEGTMLAILFMNVMAPLIDYFVVQAHIKKRTNYARALNNA